MKTIRITDECKNNHWDMKSCCKFVTGSDYIGTCEKCGKTIEMSWEVK